MGKGCGSIVMCGSGELLVGEVPSHVCYGWDRVIIDQGFGSRFE